MLACMQGLKLIAWGTILGGLSRKEGVHVLCGLQISQKFHTGEDHEVWSSIVASSFKITRTLALEIQKHLSISTLYKHVHSQARTAFNTRDAAC